MSSQPEGRFIRSVNDQLHSDVYREKMHNPMRGGTPDCYYMGFADDLWVEYKYVKKFARVVKPALSPLQMAWLMRAWDRGRRPWVVVGSPTGCMLLRGPADWRGAPWDPARVLTKPLLAREIEARCGLEGSPGSQPVAGTSTP